MCASCGTFPDDWLNEQGQALEEPPFEVNTKRCLGCEALADVRELIDQDGQESKQRKYIFGFMRKRRQSE